MPTATNTADTTLCYGPSHPEERAMQGKFALRCAFVAGLLFTLPSSAAAQSTISGQITDSSGAPVPGVNVDAASPSLIERSRTTTTALDGRYAIVDVRP